VQWHKLCQQLHLHLHFTATGPWSSHTTKTCQSMCAMAQVVLAVTHALHSNMSHEQPHKQDIPEHVCNGSGCGSSETQSCKPYRLIGNPKVKLELGMGQINLLAGCSANHNFPSRIKYPFVVLLDIPMRPHTERDWGGLSNGFHWC
jgi:hypothetical protein